MMSNASICHLVSCGTHACIHHVWREQDAEKDRKKRMADPFYLGGSSKSEDAAAVLLEEHEVESIPIFRCFG